MGFNVILFLFLQIFVAVRAIQLNLTNAWKQDIGWDILCSWSIPRDDSLQSVRLYQNNQQFMIYRPETDGDSRSLMYRRPEDVMSTNCNVSKDDRNRGTCVLTMELYQPQRDDFKITCEVSGERPYFRIERKTITVEKFVPPTDAVLRVLSAKEPGHVTLNCTASGVPSPDLSWTIGDQKIPRDFSDGAWNATSKLWEVWSVLSYTVGDTAAVCTPEISRTGQLVKGHPAEYNAAGNLKGGLFNMLVTSLLLLR